MPEIKHNFTGGKMNKDVDQRLVPKGEYRDAMNIQVSTSEGSDVGTVQNILGNSAVVNDLDLAPNSKCVGAVADEKNDALYWFVKEPLSSYNITIAESRDIIFELKNGNVKHVFVDKKQISIAVAGLHIPSSGDIVMSSQIGFDAINVGDTFQLWAYGNNLSGSEFYTVLSKDPVTLKINIGDYTNVSWANYQPSGSGELQIVPFGTGGVLKFPENIITGINIIDDMLFWTDGVTEPKKINIPRSIQGTSAGGNFHTKLIVNGIDKGLTKEEHITVIKRAPKSGVSMTLTTSRDPDLNYSGIFTISDADNLSESSLWEQRDPLNLNASWPYDLSTFTTEEGSNIIKVIIKSDLNGNTNFSLDGWEVGTKVAIKEVDVSGNLPQIPINDYTIKGAITEWLWTNNGGVTVDVNNFDSSGIWGAKLAIKVNSISRTPKIATSGTLDYVIDLFDESEKLYEFKLPRFSYRYKYEDGEYSYFAPWTDVAFNPGSFDYHPKKGYNLGMTNTVQTVQLRDFITSDMPRDVVEIDILYKEEKSPNIYTVDTFKPNDYPTILSGGVFSNNWNLNKYEISKENIMSILPSNQFLRPYDNVPKKALAQDITGSRVVYGNYVQNYNLDIDGISYKPQILHELVHDSSTLKSIKSLREYQLGVVFTDKYGRETPVLTNNTGTFKVDKNQGVNKNKLQLSLDNISNPLDMEFYKFYIKQTSGEYYNMAMDRWYDAEDGNVWVSFNSADRNKINDDTVLVLKKGVDSDELVEDPARFKVVAIENEAPDFIKIKKTIISDKAHAEGATATNIFLTGGDLPEQDSNTFSIAYHDNATHIYSNTVVKDIYNQAQHQGEDFYFQIKNAAGTTSTKPIKIAKINITDEDWADSGALTKFDIVLEEPFTSLINSFTNDTTGANVNKILDGNRAVFWSYKKENRAEFDGRFFVKLFQEDTFKEYIIDNTTAEVTEYNTLWDQKVYSFDYDSHDLVWNGASGNLPGGSSHYYASSGNSGNNPTWHHYIDITDQIALDGSSGSSIQNWKICAAFFRGINIHQGKKSGTPGWKSHGIDQRKGFDAMDLHGDPSSWDFEDVWFLDGATSDGYYSGHWDGSPQTTDHNGIGISGDMLELGFGGIQPEDDGDGSWSWYYDSGGSNGNDSDFYQLHNNKHYDNDSEGSGLASKLTAGVYFRWAEDPTETVYKINNTADHNLVRHETNQLGDDQYDTALGLSGSPYPLINEVQYATSTFFRPGNHSKNYVLTVSQVVNPTIPHTMPWDPYTSGEISGGLVLPLVVSIGMSSGGNQVTLNTLTAVDVSGFSYGARTLQVGMVCEELEAIVSKISGTTIYFKNYDSNVVNPTYAAVSAGDTLNFKQYGMNGISRNSAKNINYWNSGKGFGSSNVGVDAVGYTIEILEPEVTETIFPRFPAVFETEPTEETGLDIYYEMTDNLPVTITKENMAHIIPVGSQVAISAQDPVFGYQDGFTVLGTNIYATSSGSDILLDAWLDGAPIIIGDEVILTTPFGVKFSLLIEDITTAAGSPLRTILKLSPNLTNQKITPTWFNCYSFGNGVESDRIRDAFDKTYISNGVKVSAVLDETYKEERRKYSLIYSGIYNSMSGVNNLNQFIAAEKITKDINPIYGSIQKLHSGWGQGGDLVALCEDRVLKILANKDALYNADGNANVTSTNNVLGQAIPYSGEHGISKNPESFASEAYRIYFTDKVRGTVMRLSMDGLTPISNHGMKDWFRDKLKLGDKLIGSYDDKKDEYNITIKGDTIAKTVTFREDVKGWVSFKSFTPENAISCANEYYTFKDGNIWKHHDELVDRNTFYNGNLVPSSVEVIFNEVPGSVKSFKTVNYEGSQAKVTLETNDNEYFNLEDVPGWHVIAKDGIQGGVVTNLERGGITEFIKKEGKWFGYVVGDDVNVSVLGNISSTSNYDTEDFSIQGVGSTASVESSIIFGCMDDGGPTNLDVFGDGSNVVGIFANPSVAGTAAFNYMSAATIDDGSCVDVVMGCIDPIASNTSPTANTDDDSCLYPGCTIPLATAFNEGSGGSLNFDPNANTNDGSCVIATYGCTLTGFLNTNIFADFGSSILETAGTNCGSSNCMCIPINYGCTDGATPAANYWLNPDELLAVNTDDGSCEYTGCTDPLAENYDFADSCTDPIALTGCTVTADVTPYLNGTAYDNDSCTYIGGCMDALACNYDALNTVDDGSCYFCGDNGALNYDATTPDYNCVGTCTFCEDVASVTIISQTTSDPGMNNGTITIEWPVSTSATSYDVYGSGITTTTITPSGSATETYTITGLGTGTYTIYVQTTCTSDNGVSLLAGANLPGGVVGTAPFGTIASATITATPVIGCIDNGSTYTGGVVNPAGGEWGACNWDAGANADASGVIGGTDYSNCNYDDCVGCDSSLYVEYCGDCWDGAPNFVNGPPGSGYGPWVSDTVPTSCTTLIVSGCTDVAAFNYDPFNIPNADCAGVVGGTDTSCCVPVVYGCMDTTLNNDGTYAASNYDSSANTPCDVAGTGLGTPPGECCVDYNCPYNVGISISSGGNSFIFQAETFTTPYFFGPGSTIVKSFTITSASLGSNTTTTFNGYSNITQGTDIIGRKFFKNIAGKFTPGVDTSVTVDFNLTTTDGNCDIDATTQTFTIGCTDAPADNTGSFDITDNTQCDYTGCMDASACNYETYYTVADNASCEFCGDPAAYNFDGANVGCTGLCFYTGCMDDTPQADGSGYAASNYITTNPSDTLPCNSTGIPGDTNYDASQDNDCCTYNTTPGIQFSSASSEFPQIRYDITNTGYTEGSMSTITIGSGGTTLTHSGDTQTSMNASSSSRLAYTWLNNSLTSPIIGWHPYVNNGQLDVSVTNATFNGACDNPNINNQLPTGYASNSVSWSVGCRNDNTAFNYDPNVDLNLASSCVAVNSGCMASGAWTTVPTNNTAVAAGLSIYDAAHNTACGTPGSTTDTSCCCFNTTCSVFAPLGTITYNSGNHELTIPITLIPCAREYQYSTRSYDGSWSSWSSWTDVPATQTTLGKIVKNVNVLWPSVYDNDIVPKQIRVRAKCSDPTPTVYSNDVQANVNYTY